MIARMLKVLGDVQGVSFRHWAKKEAEKLGLLGWAKNEYDGSVSIFVQGEDVTVQEFIDWSKKGSPMSTVEQIEVNDAEIDEGLKGFTVK